MSKEEQNWAVICHLSALSMYIIPFGMVLGPLIIWLVKKDASPFINVHGKAALNFQLSLFVYAIISGILIFVVIGAFLLIALAVMQIVCIVLAAVQASKGDYYNYPLSISFIK